MIITKVVDPTISETYVIEEGEHIPINLSLLQTVWRFVEEKIDYISVHDAVNAYNAGKAVLRMSRIWRVDQ
ncbi:hypothetical protein [Metabacillus idriensis]|uniref:hypothetical protein n=1 Tax=Metabacillus idriensis TaxID=324768 RepID=UPI001747FF6B|nr:hypothetical protein [Metabacillus idriensis]